MSTTISLWLVFFGSHNKWGHKKFSALFSCILSQDTKFLYSVNFLLIYSSQQCSRSDIIRKLKNVVTWPGAYFATYCNKECPVWCTFQPSVIHQKDNSLMFPRILRYISTVKLGNTLAESTLQKRCTKNYIWGQHMFMAFHQSQHFWAHTNNMHTCLSAFVLGKRLILH